MKLRRLSILCLILLLLIPVLPVSTQARGENDPAIWYTRTWNDNTFRYLNEIYIEKYPELGLRWIYGSERERQHIAKLAGIITAGCSTDTEKALAVLKWVQRNIVYDDLGGNFYSYDVFYNRSGNCIGQAELIQDLLRQLGIPAVVGDGIRGDMENRLTVRTLPSVEDGHAWCFAYLEGEWALLDPLWLPGANTDRDFLAKWYYMDAIEGICPAYEMENMPSLRSPDVSAFYYIDGRFMCYDGTQVEGTGTLSISINMVHSYSGNINTTVPGGSQDGIYYVDNPQRKDEMLFGEVYRDGWTYYDRITDISSYSYAYENGIMAGGTVMTLNGERYFMETDAVKLAIPEGAYSVAYGKLALKPGFTGKVILPAFSDHYETEGLSGCTYQIVWESDDPTVATVDQNGVVTNLREGTTRIRVLLKRSDGNTMAGSVLTVRFYAEDLRTPDYNDYNNHTQCVYTIYETVAPTCTHIGYTEGVCSCGNLKKMDIVPAKGHAGSWTVITEATANTTGLRRRVCTVCGETEEQVIPSLNSGETLPPEGTYVCNSHQFSEWEVLLETTEESDGFRIRTCMSCGYQEGEVIPRPECEHRYGSWQVVLEPSHVEEGVSGRLCSKCGKWEYQGIPPLLDAHEWSRWETIMQPDRYNTGLRIRYCISCGHMEEEILPAAGGSEGSDSTRPTQGVPSCTNHQYGPWEVVQEPTQTQAGMCVRECVVCGSKEVEILKPTGTEEPKPSDSSVTILMENPKMMQILSESDVGDAVILPVDPGITGVQMPSELIAAMADADIKPTFAYPSASVAFDHNAVTAMVPQLESGDVTLKVKNLAASELTAAQRAALAQQKVALLLSMDLICGEKEIRNFAPGTVTVSLPVVPETGCSLEDYAVFYVTETGRMEKMPVSVSGGKLIFTTDHFSAYAVVNTSTVVTQPDPTVPESTVPSEPSGATEPTVDTTLPTEPSAETTVATVPTQQPTQATGQTPSATEATGSATESSGEADSPTEPASGRLWILFVAGGVAAAVIGVICILKKRK